MLVFGVLCIVDAAVLRIVLRNVPVPVVIVVILVVIIFSIVLVVMFVGISLANTFISLPLFP